MELLTLLQQLAETLSGSRRAAYHVQQWLSDLGGPQSELLPDEMLAALLTRELLRHGDQNEVITHGSKDEDKIGGLTAQLIQFARVNIGPQMDKIEFISNCFTLTEFLSREGRL